MNTTAALVILGTLATPTVIWSLTYFVRVILVALSRPVNLKKKYGAEWALVTGGSSGIGKSLCRRLAEQGLNVVVVALEDQLLKDTVAELKAAFPERQFIMVGANLSPGQKYMEKIAKATKDISVQCVFNNAGYIVTGFFEQVPVERQLANVECNATAAVAITHHFLVPPGLRGQAGVHCVHLLCGRVHACSFFSDVWSHQGLPFFFCIISCY